MTSRRVAGRWPVTLLVGLATVGATCVPAAGQGRSSGRHAPTGDRSFADSSVLDRYAPALDGIAVDDRMVAVGRALFGDRRLSRDGTLSCAGCHRPDLAFADDRAVAVGVDGRRGPRNVPSLVNRAYGRAFSWDGRAATLLEQVLLPIENPLELDAPVETVIDRLDRDPATRSAFTEAFGGAPTRERLALALTAYVASIRSEESAFDRHFLGDTLGLDAEQRAGRRIFIGKGGCRQCHLGPNLTDEGFHVTGVAWTAGTADDLGRFGVSGDSAQLGAFKTPSLRDVERTAPYMHDGSIATLEEVIDFYDRGGVANPHLDPKLKPLELSEREKHALAAFLRSLSGTIREGIR